MAETFKESILTEQKLKDFTFVKARIHDLQEFRKQQHYGTNLESLWAESDREYVPHRLGTKSRRNIVSDEDKGWRGALVSLGTSNWQSDIAQTNPYTKIQTALSILVDRNPSGVFLPASKRYTATTELIKQLYQRSWEYSKSKNQLKLFIYNLAKYGWSAARTYPLRITRKVKVLEVYNQDDPESSEYKEKEIVEFNDIFRENLDPWNVWIDDMARPSNQFSIRDWCWRKIYPMDAAKEEFGKYKNWKFVTPGGITTDKVVQINDSNKQFKEKNLVEVYFYENRLKDLFMVIANGIPVIIEPLPISDAKGIKKLSLWQAYWTLRNAESPYGIGIYEAIRYDQKMLDRIRNMTIDQLTLSIYKMFFYTGTQMLQETGDIKITPGVGKQVLNPRDVNWLEVPGPGQDAWLGIERFKKDIDESSGISDTLEGTITGKTAFEVAQAKEAALKRIKSPLDNVLEALDTEAYITISLIQILYSIPETYKIADPNLIEDYLQEVGSDPDLYERDEEGTFTAKVYPEFPLQLEEDEGGNLIETGKTQFFRVKPKLMQWEGIVTVKAQSILTGSKQVDKALELEMYNILIPLLAQPPEIYAKLGKNLVRLYDKDPRDILPDSWIATEGQNPQDQPLFIPAAEAQAMGQPTVPGAATQAPGAATQAPRAAVTAEIPSRPTNLAQKLVARISNPFRRV